jgi:hypothetical protein
MFGRIGEAIAHKHGVSASEDGFDFPQLVQGEVRIAHGDLKSFKSRDDLLGKFTVALRHSSFAAGEHGDRRQLLEVLDQSDDERALGDQDTSHPGYQGNGLVTHCELQHLDCVVDISLGGKG